MMPQAMAAPRNDWRCLDPRPIGALPAEPLTVTVVMPAFECQPQLDLSLAALACQSYPAELLDVIVVDDRSQPPLQLPPVRPTTRILRAEGTGHGSGRARDTGAREADGDVVLFLDADIIASRHHVDAHVRWHEATEDAVVLGFKDFVDTSGLSVDDVVSAVRTDELLRLVEGREREPHEWIEKALVATEDLGTDREDLWRVVVGASVSTRRSLYREAGGFAHFPRRGIVDTEFGYRCFTAGGLIVPERAAQSLHQGARSFASRGQELARLRAPLIANHIAHRRYRSPVRGRQWAVPYLRVIVIPGGADFRQVQRTVDDVLANEFDDLAVTVEVDPLGPDSDLYADYWQPDGRVDLVSAAPVSGFPSPATLILPAGCRLAASSLTALLTHFRRWESGLLNVSVTGVEPPAELWATRALHRTRRAAGGHGHRQTVRHLFGETWLAGSDLGIGASEGASDRVFAKGQFHAVAR